MMNITLIRRLARSIMWQLSTQRLSRILSMFSDMVELEIFLAEICDDTLEEVEGGIEAKTVLDERRWWGLWEISVGIELSSWKFTECLTSLGLNSQLSPNLLPENRVMISKEINDFYEHDLIIWWLQGLSMLTENLVIGSFQCYCFTLLSSLWISAVSLYNSKSLFSSKEKRSFTEMGTILTPLHN